MDRLGSVGRLGYVVGRLWSGMRVSASFQYALYRLAHGGCGRGNVVHHVKGRGNVREICPRGKYPTVFRSERRHSSSSATSTAARQVCDLKTQSSQSGVAGISHKQDTRCL